MSLEQIFEQQITLNKRINSKLYEDIQKNPELKREWFLKFEKALSQESAEAIDSLNWKWWKQDADDWDNVKVELVDMLHFWVSMCTIAGLDAKDVYDLYAKKNKLNFKRQDEGYQDGTYDKYKDGVEDNRLHVINK
ncbi:dUTPase [bacterium]|nr:dUTPase [Actinomycetota bacterium]MBE33673.1 dUTPase [bacterium]|tara:strand:+ start:14504 stop:14911 length:408 start_codon:yes stop_codon:yes gene_type:complete